VRPSENWRRHLVAVGIEGVLNSFGTSREDGIATETLRARETGRAENLLRDAATSALAIGRRILQANVTATGTSLSI